MQLISGIELVLIHLFEIRKCAYLEDTGLDLFIYNNKY